MVLPLFWYFQNIASVTGKEITNKNINLLKPGNLGNFTPFRRFAYFLGRQTLTHFWFPPVIFI